MRLTNKTLNKWRDSASLIITTAISPDFGRRELSRNHNYKVLLLKRGKNASFMPGKYVFPGGTVESSDKDPKWKDFYESKGFDESLFHRLFPESDRERAVIFQKDSNSNELAKEISLRITAIRETFEESGILFCKPSDDKMFASRASCYEFGKPDLLKKWQEKVQKDSSEFINMCEHFNCVPNVWNLIEWSNWLTPTTVYGGKRFNTIFFIAFFGKMPNIVIDPREIETSVCEYPSVLLESTEELSLAPPQYYELCDIGKEGILLDLWRHAIDRNYAGAYLKFPLIMKVNDASVYLLPGDRDYPKNVSLTEQHIIEKKDVSVLSLNNKSEQSLHRLIIYNESHQVELYKSNDINELSIETNYCE